MKIAKSTCEKIETGMCALPETKIPKYRKRSRNIIYDSLDNQTFTESKKQPEELGEN